MKGKARIVGVILARATSSRFPGKHLKMLGGKTLLEILASRLQRCGEIDDLVAAIPEGTDHLGLETEFRRLGIPVRKGSEDDVSGRFLEAAKSHGADWAARINGDCLFQDPALLGEGARIARAGGVEFVTNIPGRTWPYGISLELVELGGYARFRESFESPSHFEHVTGWLYENPSRVRSAVVPYHGDATFDGVRMVVDTPEDLRRIDVALEGIDPTTIDALQAAMLFMRSGNNHRGDSRC